MAITLQPFEDAAYPGQVIEAGVTEQIGQKKRVVSVAGNEGESLFLDFFGFQTASAKKSILNVSVIMYNKDALFRSRF